MSVNGPSLAYTVGATGASPLPGPRSPLDYIVSAGAASQPNSVSTSPEFTERHRLLAAIRERAAETAAAVVTSMPRPGSVANGVCSALVDEHSSMMRCFNLLQESGNEMKMPIPPLKIPEERKTVKKRHKKKIKRHQGDTSTQIAIINNKRPTTFPRNRRKCKNPPCLLRIAKQKIQNPSQRDLIKSQENMKQRTLRSSVKKKMPVDQKSSLTLTTKSQKLSGDKKKKVHKTASAKKFNTMGNPPKSVSRTQSTIEMTFSEEKKQVKHRRGKPRKSPQKGSKESLDLALTSTDIAHDTMRTRAEGDGPKRISKKTKRSANKNYATLIPTTNVHRKPQVKNEANTPRKGILKCQPTNKNKGTLMLCKNEENPPKQIDTNLLEINTNQSSNKGVLPELSLDARNVCPVAVASVSTKTNLPIFGALSGDPLSLESEKSQQSVTAETTETCLRSILRDTNKKLVSIGSKTVRFFEDTLPAKKFRKRKVKGSKKSLVLLDKPMYRAPWKNLNRSPSRENVVGFSRTVAPEKSIETLKKKRRGKSTVKEKKIPMGRLEYPLSDNELLESKKEDSVVEVTPLKQKKLYGQMKVVEGKTEFPLARSEELLDLSPLNDYPENSLSKTNNTTDLRRNSANLEPERQKPLRKIIDDSHVPSSLILRCRRKSLKDTTNRYSTLLADFPKTKDLTATNEKISRTSMKTHYSILENSPQKKSSTIPHKRRSTDIPKDRNNVNRTIGSKPAFYSLGINNNLTKQIENEKLSGFRKPNRKSLSQTTIKNATRLFNSDHLLNSPHSATGTSRLSLDLPAIRRNQKMNLRYLGTRRDLGARLSHSVSASQATPRCKITQRDPNSLYEVDKSNFLPQEDKSISSHDWLKGIRPDYHVFHSHLEKSPKWTNGGMAQLPPSPTSIFANNDTMKVDDIYFSETPISEGDSSASRRVNVEEIPYVQLSHTENNPAIIRCKSPKRSANKFRWKHSPSKYVFEVVSGESSENPSLKSSKNYYRYKNKSSDGQRLKSREWKLWASETEDEGSRTANNSEYSDLTGRRARYIYLKNKNNEWPGSKTNFHKNISYSSEIDDDGTPRKPRSSPTRQRPTKIERKLTPNMERNYRLLQDSRSWSGHRVPSARSKPMDSRICDGRSSHGRLKPLRTDDSFSTTNSYSFTSVRKPNYQPSRNRIEEKRYTPSFKGSASSNNPSSRRSNRRKLEYFDLTRL